MKEKPKICAIDLDREIIEALQARGLHCFTGTLGSQVKVPTKQASLLKKKEKIENEYKNALIKIEEEIQQNQIE